MIISIPVEETLLIKVKIESGGPALSDSDPQPYYSFSNFRQLSAGANIPCPVHFLTNFTSQIYSTNDKDTLDLEFVVTNSSVLTKISKSLHCI